MAISLKLSVNGAPVTVSVEPHTLLVQLLREHLRLTGTHVGYRAVRRLHGAHERTRGEIVQHPGRPG